jgi:hypothetical protein
MLRLHIMELGVEFLGDNYAGKDNVSMGESNNEEIANSNDNGGSAERNGWMSDMRLVSPSGSTAMSTVGNVCQPLLDCQRM